MNRRSLLAKLATLGAVAVLPLKFVACAGQTAAQIVTDIQNYVALAKTAFNSLLNVLTTNGVLTPALATVGNEVIKALSDIATAVANYLATPVTGLLGAISTALQVAENSVQVFWSDLSIGDPTLEAIITGALAVIISTIAGYIALLPPTPAPTGMVMARRRMQVAPKRRSPKQFRHDFNKVLKGTKYAGAMI